MKSSRDKFKNAMRGLGIGMKDHAIRIQLGFMVIAIALGFVFSFSLLEWCLLLVCIAFVVTMEFVNTVVERIMDFIHPDYHDKVRDIKDMAAGFVFLSAVFALVIGMLLFGSKLF